MLRHLRGFAEAAYVAALGWPSTQRVNAAVLRMAALGRGYGHIGTIEQTGEAAFIASIGQEPVGLCLDIGANSGEYSKALLERTNATVVAFEPQATPFHDLSDLHQRFPDRFMALNVGVAASPGKLVLHWGDNSQLASFSESVMAIEYVRRSNVRSSHVPVTTIDAFFEAEGRRFSDAELTLLKIDTEGFEYEVLKGAERTLRERRPKYVQLELNHHQLFRGHTLYSMSKLLDGYAVHQILPRARGMLRVSPDDPLANLFGYANFVFVRESNSRRKRNSAL